MLEEGEAAASGRDRQRLHGQRLHGHACGRLRQAGSGPLCLLTSALRCSGRRCTAGCLLLAGTPTCGCSRSGCAVRSGACCPPAPARTCRPQAADLLMPPIAVSAWTKSTCSTLQVHAELTYEQRLPPSETVPTLPPTTAHAASSLLRLHHHSSSLRPVPCVVTCTARPKVHSAPSFPTIHSPNSRSTTSAPLVLPLTLHAPLHLFQAMQLMLTECSVVYLIDAPTPQAWLPLQRPV